MLFIVAGLVLLASPRSGRDAVDWCMIALASVAVVIAWTVRRIPWSVRLVLPAVLAFVLIFRW